jgi:glutaredoxin
MNIELNNVLVRHQSVPDCDWCDKSKDLLDQKGIKFKIIDSYKKFFFNLMQVTHSKKVPQIILNGEFVGDYNDLVEHFNGT